MGLLDEGKEEERKGRERNIGALFLLTGEMNSCYIDDVEDTKKFQIKQSIKLIALETSFACP